MLYILFILLNPSRSFTSSAVGSEQAERQRQGRKGHWFAVQTKLTRAHGHVFFLVHIGRRAASFRLVFRGTRNFGRSVSAVDTIAPATSA